MMHTFSLDPRDVLFFRDARPMGGSDAGLGARFPRPDQLHAALLSAFVAQWPRRQPWEGAEHTFRPRTDANRSFSHDLNENSTLRFGGLHVEGPFLEFNGELYFPTPLDLGMRLVPLRSGETNLPAPLSMAFLPEKREKRSLPGFLPMSRYIRYLAGETTNIEDIPPLFETERTTSTAIDPATGTAAESSFYQAEYLRLAPGVRFVFLASCIVHPKGGGPDVDVFSLPDAPHVFQMGGQAGTVYLEKATPIKWPAPATTSTRTLVRWTLLSPGLFRAGWLPGWLDPVSGRVMLRRGDGSRQPGESRLEWRKRLASLPEFPSAHLVAARIGKPLAFSGWDILQNAPKPTSLAVPAGSSYVFACDSSDEANALATLLAAPHPHSDLFGEKGFGIGLCSFLNTPTC